MSDVSYDGPIKPGLRFIWEPGKPHAHELIEVVRVSDTGDMVRSRAVGGIEYWNDVSRFRESVVPLRCYLDNDQPCRATILEACLCGSYASWYVYERDRTLAKASSDLPTSAR
jgi:hypothetical protein